MNLPVFPPHAVRGENRVEQTHVTRVGGDARVQQLSVGEFAIGLDPDALVRLDLMIGTPRQLADESLVNGMGSAEPLVDHTVGLRDALLQGRQRLGRRDLGHRELVLEALLGHVKAGFHVVDRPTVLHGHHAPRREALAVADAVDFVEDRNLRIARTQKVRVQRVDVALIHGAPRRHECLGGDLSTEDALTLLVGLDPAEDVLLDRLEVEQVDEEIEGVGHPSIVVHPVTTTRASVLTV